MASKHGPNRLRSYFAIHNTVMEQYRRDGFVVSDDLEVLPHGDGALRMQGAIRCAGGALVVTVDKILRVVNDLGDDVEVENVFYAYNVSVAGWNNVFRYDNAHAYPGHRDRHHRHAFDYRTGAPTEVRWIGPEWPTLGEVIEEARVWYWANIDDLERR